VENLGDQSWRFPYAYNAFGRVDAASCPTILRTRKSKIIATGRKTHGGRNVAPGIEIPLRPFFGRHGRRAARKRRAASNRRSRRGLWRGIWITKTSSPAQRSTCTRSRARRSLRSGATAMGRPGRRRSRTSPHLKLPSIGHVSIHRAQGTMHFEVGPAPKRSPAITSPWASTIDLNACAHPGRARDDRFPGDRKNTFRATMRHACKASRRPDITELVGR